jgi:hypothetical protein
VSDKKYHFACETCSAKCTLNIDGGTFATPVKCPFDHTLVPPDWEEVE